tara:strand:- start:1573 stop:1884 length:312 start_codon:yes stop_codon:yes gene_type:complete
MLPFIDNLKNWNLWLRGVFILILGVVCYYGLTYVVFILALVQFVFYMVTGGKSKSLSSFSSVVTQYITKSIEYMTFSSDEPPVPFDQINIDIKPAKKSSGKKS